MTTAPKHILLGFHWNYMESLHRGALRRLSELGWTSAILTGETLRRVTAVPVDGVLGPLPEDPSHPVRRWVDHAAVPVVDLTRSDSGNRRAGWFPSDSEAVARMAADYLRRQPVASFAFVADAEVPTHAARRKAFLAALRGTGRPCRVFLVPPGVAAARREFVAALKTMPRPVAIWGSVDICAQLALAGAREAGLSVPGDAYILGFGDRELICDFASVPISSIAIDYTAWGYAAMDFLADLILGKCRPGEQRFFPPSGVTERVSTIGESPGALLASRAETLMRLNVASPLSVAELAAVLAVSKSTLERVFAAERGVGVARYDLALRMEIARGLLGAGEKASAVAAAVGFASYRAFGVAFRKHTGVAPGRLGNRSSDRRRAGKPAVTGE